MEKRRVLRSVRNIESEGSVIDAAHHILVDDLSSWLGVGSPPSPTLMVEELRKLGYRASLAHYGKPSFKTDASWDDIVEVSLGINHQCRTSRLCLQWMISGYGFRSIYPLLISRFVL